MIASLGMESGKNCRLVLNNHYPHEHQYVVLRLQHTLIFKIALLYYFTVCHLEHSHLCRVDIPASHFSSSLTDSIIAESVGKLQTWELRHPNGSCRSSLVVKQMCLYLKKLQCKYYKNSLSEATKSLGDWQSNKLCFWN